MIKKLTVFVLAALVFGLAACKIKSPAEVFSKVTYAGGLGIAVNVPSSLVGDKVPTHLVGTTITVAENPPYACLYIFKGWRNSSDNKLYQPGETFVMPASDVALTAEWEGPATIGEKDTYKTTLSALAGSNLAAFIVNPVEIDVDLTKNNLLLVKGFDTGAVSMLDFAFNVEKDADGNLTSTETSYTQIKVNKMGYDIDIPLKLDAAKIDGNALSATIKFGTLTGGAAMMNNSGLTLTGNKE